MTPKRPCWVVTSEYRCSTRAEHDFSHKFYSLYEIPPSPNMATDENTLFWSLICMSCNRKRGTLEQLVYWLHSQMNNRAFRPSIVWWKNFQKNTFYYKFCQVKIAGMKQNWLCKIIIIEHWHFHSSKSIILKKNFNKNNHKCWICGHMGLICVQLCLHKLSTKH